MSRVVYKEVVEFQCVHVHGIRQYMKSIHVHFGKWVS